MDCAPEIKIESMENLTPPARPAAMPTQEIGFWTPRSVASALLQMVAETFGPSPTRIPVRAKIPDKN